VRHLTLEALFAQLLEDAAQLFTSLVHFILNNTKINILKHQHL
jgi:hypothetical protein